MRLTARFCSLASTLVLLGLGAVAQAESADVVVAKVGQGTVLLANLTRRLDALANFQLRSLGKTVPAQGRQYVEQVMVPELLLAEHGKKLPLLETPRMQAKKQAFLRDLLVAKLESQQLAGPVVGEEEVRRYYDEHPELFVQKERIRLQRLLVGDEAHARTLIAKAKQFSSMDDWRNLVRETSLDKATSERGGELGFVGADGSTDVPELEVAPGLFAAAKQVKDGEVVPEPVAEGKRYAVLWRRGSRPERVIEFAKESPQIREHLTQLRAERRLRELVAQLRQEHLKDYRPTAPEVTDFSFIFERGFAKPQ